MKTKKKLAPTHRAVVDKLKRDGRIKWRDTTRAESRALIALVKKGIVREIFQPYGYTYFELLSQEGV